MPQVKVGALDIEVERFGEGEPLLLIQGLGAQLVLWPRGFCEALAAEGFEVARFDNRDIGLSTRLSHLPVPSLTSLAVRDKLGLSVRAPYSLSEMAFDAAGVIEALGWESAHVVGVSMGGMIAQRLAIEHPKRVRSLTSMSSTTGDRRVGQPRLRAQAALVGPRPTTREEAGEMMRRTFGVIGSPGYPEPEARWRELGALSFDRGMHPQGFLRQLAAIIADGDRTPLLRQLDVPTLVLHGLNDPLVPDSGGRATAAAIPGAKLELFPGLGHDIPSALWPRLTRLIANHARGA